MSWNYRLVEVKVGGGTHIGICEVHYDKGGFPIMRTENFVKLSGDCAEDVREDYDLILGAFSKPVLTDKDFNYDERGV